MVIVQICVGSSCHLKGAPEIVALFEKSVKEQKLDDEVILAGSFCSGKCNRVGVTVTVNDEIFTGVTPESFKEFWHDHIVPKLGVTVDGKDFSVSPSTTEEFFNREILGRMSI